MRRFCDGMFFGLKHGFEQSAGIELSSGHHTAGFFEH
jgi:hypothetical protein